MRAYEKKLFIEAEARKIISDIISSTGASGVRDMGK
ncbi:MAG TPA: glutamyl-tRNA amidotransferase, partial [Chitinophagaceae bacterium]|nr:glutamyl-tRNA amidotransferase [Chitinophagaceae bacterium]